MKLGILGPPQSGKNTIFESLTRTATGRKGENRLGTVPVPDERVDDLSLIYKPRKTTFAQVDTFLPGTLAKKKEGEMGWASVRDCDAFLVVIRNFGDPAMKPEPLQDWLKMEEEMVFQDLLVCEKRLERLNTDRQRGRPVPEDEYRLIERCKSNLEKGVPLRRDQDLATSPLLKGFAFLTARPVMILVNNGDEDTSIPVGLSSRETCLVIRGKLEQELAQIEDKDRLHFFEEYSIEEPAVNRAIKTSYRLLGLISFFTVGEDEVRAWTIRQGTKAEDAAEVIHSDIKKGFIRAEVVSYRDFREAGSYPEARKKGWVRLEGKTYTVQDGDIIDFRFNV